MFFEDDKSDPNPTGSAYVKPIFVSGVVLCLSFDYTLQLIK